MENKDVACEFSVAARIYDLDLAQKISKRLSQTGFCGKADKLYFVTVSFDVKVYDKADFYAYPVELKAWQQEKIAKESREGRAQTLIGEILSQQLHKICECLPSFSVKLKMASIAGEDFEDIERVDFKLEYEDMPEPENKKGKKNTVFTSYCVIPHRPSITKKIAEVFTKIILENMEKERTKKRQMAAHTPHHVMADEFFKALAGGIAADYPDDVSDIEALADKLLSQARLINDWPLEITGDARDSSFPRVIDCPEYCIYSLRGGIWSIKKVADLGYAKMEILRLCALKSVKQIVVMNRLASLRFSLFKSQNSEIVEIERANAHAYKNLLIKWEK